MRHVMRSCWTSTGSCPEPRKLTYMQSMRLTASLVMRSTFELKSHMHELIDRIFTEVLYPQLVHMNDFLIGMTWYEHVAMV